MHKRHVLSIFSRHSVAAGFRQCVIILILLSTFLQSGYEVFLTPRGKGLACSQKSFQFLSGNLCILMQYFLVLLNSTGIDIHVTVISPAYDCLLSDVFLLNPQFCLFALYILHSSRLQC